MINQEFRTYSSKMSGQGMVLGRMLVELFVISGGELYEVWVAFLPGLSPSVDPDHSRIRRHPDPSLHFQPCYVIIYI